MNPKLIVFSPPCKTDKSGEEIIPLCLQSGRKPEPLPSSYVDCGVRSKTSANHTKEKLPLTARQSKPWCRETESLPLFLGIAATAGSLFPSSFRCRCRWQVILRGFQGANLHTHSDLRTRARHRSAATLSGSKMATQPLSRG